MECYTYLRNVTDLLSDGKTPYERRFGQPFIGPIIPFGSLVEYHPVTAKDKSRIHQFGKKVLPGLFLGYALYAGGIWKGDTMVADIEELETMDASEICSTRLNAKEVIFPKEKGDFIFPIADGRIKPLGGDQDLRTSTSTRQRPIQETHLDFLGESIRRVSSTTFFFRQGKGRLKIKSQKRSYATMRTSDGRHQSPRTWKAYPRPRQGHPDAPARTMRETWQRCKPGWKTT